jgi:pilus assembly protein CpaE
MTLKNTNNLLGIIAFIEDKTNKDIVNSLTVKLPDLSFEVYQGGIKQAVQYLRSHPSPQILLVDISKSELALSDMEELSEVCEPGIEVICVGEKNEVSLFRNLIDLGVQDYLVKPLTLSLLLKSIQNLPSKVGPDSKESTFTRQGKTIAFVGAKGGIGTSTLAANCGWILADKERKKISLVDLDLKFGALGQFFDLPYTQRLTDLLESPERIDEVFVERMFAKYNEHLSIISSVEPLNTQSKIPKESIEKLVSLLRKKFHYIIYDFSREFHNPTYTPFLEKIDIIAIITDFTIHSLRDTIRIIEFFNEKNNPHQRIVLIANKAGEYKQGQLTQEIYQETIKHKIDIVLSFDPLKPLKALNEGTPVASSNGSLSADLYKLTSLLVEKPIGSSTFKANKKSFFSGFFTNKS